MRSHRRSFSLLSGCPLFLLICIVIAFSGCRKDDGALPRIDGKKVVMIIAEKDFRDEELFDTKEIIEKAGAEVTVASSSLKAAKGMLGGTQKPDILLKDVAAEKFDAVVFVGGTGASQYWEDDAALSLARTAAGSGRLVCAICIAPVTLANAGLLDGKKATVWKDQAGTIQRKGGKYTKARVETDGNIITADGPRSSKEFARAIVRALSG
jgi:protease I